MPETASTGDGGTATVKLTPTDPSAGLKLSVRAPGLAADVPVLYVPARRDAARNAQRLVAPAGTSARVEASAPVKAAPQVVTQISAQSAAPGSAITDTVKVSGLAGQTVTVQAALYGPYPAPDKITCTDAPVWTGSFVADHDGDYVTAPVTLSVPGYYTYRESIADSPTVTGVQTACADAAETTVIRGAPAITTQVSAQQSRARRADHRHRGRHRAGQAGGDRERRALGPVPDARGDPLRGHARLDRAASRRTATAATPPHRSRCRPRATTPTARRSRRRPRSTP